MAHENGEIFPIKNQDFTMGEYADGYLGMYATVNGKRVRLRFTSTSLQSMVKNADKNAEDFEAIEDKDKSCGILDLLLKRIRNL